MREKGKGMAWCDSSLQTAHQWLFISINLYGKNVEQEEKLRLNWFYLGLLVSVTVTSLPYIWLLLDKVRVVDDEWREYGAVIG